MHHCCRNFKSHLTLKYALQVLDLDGHLGIQQQVFDSIACAFMKLYMSALSLAKVILILRILNEMLAKSQRLLVRDTKALSNLLQWQLTFLAQVLNASHKLLLSKDASLL